METDGVRQVYGTSLDTIVCVVVRLQGNVEDEFVSLACYLCGKCVPTLVATVRTLRAHRMCEKSCRVFRGDLVGKAEGCV